MAKKYSGDVRVYFERYEVGTASVSVGVKREVDALDQTALGDVAERTLAGIRKDGLEWSGYFDDGTSFDAFKAANIGSGTLPCSIFIGTSTGNVAYGALTRLYLEVVSMGGKGIVMAGGNLRPDATLNRGVVLTARVTGTGSSVSGSVDNAALNTGSGFWFLHVFSIGAGTTSTIALEDSADGVIFADLAVQVISTATAYRISVGSGAAGTIRRYTRMRWDATGTKSLASMVVRA